MADITHIASLRDDNTLISPTGTLDEARRAIETGKINPDKLLVLSLQTKNENGLGAYKVKWFLSNLRMSEAVALLEVAKVDLTDILTGKTE